MTKMTFDQNEKKKDWLTANDRGSDIRDRPFKHIYCVQ